MDETTNFVLFVSKAHSCPPSLPCPRGQPRPGILLVTPAVLEAG